MLIFKRVILNSNTYNLGWKDHPNFKWRNNQLLNSNQGVQQAPQRKPSPLEKALQSFIKSTQESFSKVNQAQENMTKYQQEMAQNQILMNKNTEASLKDLEMQVGQLSCQMTAEASSSGGFIGNIVDNPKNEMCKAIELRNIAVPFEPIKGKEKK